MTIQTGPATAEELLRKPDDSFRYELVRGELRKMSPAGSEYGAIAFNVGRLLRNQVVERRLGQVYAAETSFKLASDLPTPCTLPMRLSSAANV